MGKRPTDNGVANDLVKYEFRQRYSASARCLGDFFYQV